MEQQKKLWESAENPGRNLWLEAQGVVPLKQEYKPPVTLLSRKPAPTIAKRDTTNGMANLTLDDDYDSEEEIRKKREADFEERQRKAKIEREEKQRKYAEARERIMGSPAAPASRESSQGRDNRKTRSRGNGSTRNSQPASPSNQSPARPTSGDPQLFDPNDMGRRLPRREATSSPLEDQPTRQPRGPDRGGRGGFGFSARGAKGPV